MYSWNPIDRNFDNESLQSGVLEGIRVVNPPKRISLRPNFTGSALRNSASSTTSTGAAGADIKIGLNKSCTLIPNSFYFQGLSRSSDHVKMDTGTAEDPGSLSFWTSAANNKKVS